jgi:2-(1,2-epoxy-1,2-dihydrophenyl)acetyl-CoA isomerase
VGYAKVKLVCEQDVALITLADPATLNAVDPTMVEELTDAFGRAGREARCVVLTGEGRAFSAGANLSAGAPVASEDGRLDVGIRLEQQYNPFVTMLRELPIPFVTAVNGAAAGIGCSFALMGDLIFAGESAYFLQAFRRIGLVPDGGATYLLPRITTRARAMELMLLGERLPAAKALEWGIINRCTTDADLLDEAMKLAAELANGPTRALAMIRALAWRSLDSHWHEQLQAEREAQREAGRTEDFAEGVKAFYQKRPAQFNGS